MVREFGTNMAVLLRSELGKPAGLAAQPLKLCSVLGSNLIGKRICKRKNTCVYDRISLMCNWNWLILSISCSSKMRHRKRASLVPQLVKNPPAVRGLGSTPGLEDPWRRERSPVQYS